MIAENQSLELKSKVDNFRQISTTACAFANAYGGKILIGITNNGKMVGVPDKDLDSMQQRIEGAIQVVSPVPFHKISVEEKGGEKIITTEIYKIGHGAFCTFGGIVYYRNGSSNTKLEGRTLQEYLINRQILSFDESKSKASIDDIDREKLRKYLEERSPKISLNNKSIKEILLNLGLIQENGKTQVKNTALLFFAKDITKFLPQSEIKLARFSGTTPVDIIDSRFVNNTILDNLREAEDFIKKNTKTAIKIETKLKREENPEYPLKVIREALVNALTHRDYFSQDAVQINIFDDRIEILNPGTLPAGLTLKILGTLSIQRNHLTYRLMRDIGLVEGLATGIPRMRFTMKEAGLPEPIFEELGSFFRITLYNKPEKSDGTINPRQKRAISYLEKNPTISSQTYRKLTGVSHPTAVMDLKDLTKKGILRKVGKTRGTYYVKKTQ